MEKTHSSIIFKKGCFDKNDTSLIHWKIEVNNSHEDLLRPSIIDIIGSNQILIPNTFLFDYRDFNHNTLKKFSLSMVGESENERTKLIITNDGFIVNLENLGTSSIINNFYSVVVEYQTKITSSLGNYINSVEMTDETGNLQKQKAIVKKINLVSEAVSSPVGGSTIINNIGSNTSRGHSLELIPEKTKKVSDLGSESFDRNDKLEKIDNIVNKLKPPVVSFQLEESSYLYKNAHQAVNASLEGVSKMDRKDIHLTQGNSVELLKAPLVKGNDEVVGDKMMQEKRESKANNIINGDFSYDSWSENDHNKNKKRSKKKYGNKNIIIILSSLIFIAALIFLILKSKKSLRK